MKKLYVLTLVAFLFLSARLSAQCVVSINSITPTNLSINASATGTGAQLPVYLWSWGDNTPFGSGASATHTYATAGTYTVCVIYSDSLSPFTCFDSTCQVVNVVNSGIKDIAQPFKATIGAYPSPFGSTTNIIYTLSHPAEVKIHVYDLLGKDVATLAETNAGAGSHTIEWNALNIPAGVYFLELKAGDISLNKKIFKNK
jgi:hypothetical protein